MVRYVNTEGNRIGSNMDESISASMDAGKTVQGRTWTKRSWPIQMLAEPQNRIGSNRDEIFLANKDARTTTKSYFVEHRRNYLGLTRLHGCGNPSCSHQIRRSTPRDTQNQQLVRCSSRSVRGSSSSSTSFISTTSTASATSSTAIV